MFTLQSAFVPGAPGGPELLILLFILLFFALPLLLIVVVVWFLTRDRDDDAGDPSPARDEPVDLERRVAALERRVERLEADRGRDADRDHD